MRNTLTILQKELRGYFASPVAYGLMAFFALVSGYFFYLYVRFFVEQSFQMQMSGRSMPMNVNEQVISPLLLNVSVISLFLVPMITMRLFAEEKRSGTIELLITSPIKDWEIILGKFLAALLLYASILLLSMLNVLALFAYGRPDWKPMLAGYLGLLLLGGCLLSIGTFISTTTRNQIIAGTATFAICLLLWIIEAVTQFQSDAWSKAVGYLSVISHFEPFSKGVIDSKDVIFYLSMIFFWLFLTSRSLESLRWRS